MGIGWRDHNATIDRFIATCKKRAFGKQQATEKLDEPSHMLAEVADDERTLSFHVLSLARDVPCKQIEQSPQTKRALGLLEQQALQQTLETTNTALVRSEFAKNVSHWPKTRHVFAQRSASVLYQLTPPFNDRSTETKHLLFIGRYCIFCMPGVGNISTEKKKENKKLLHYYVYTY